jgi:hypothetical protein
LNVDQQNSHLAEQMFLLSTEINRTLSLLLLGNQLTQDEGQSDDSKCPLSQVVATICAYLVQPASTQIPQTPESHHQS